MTILIPIVILGLLMGAIGWYFVTHEGKEQQARRPRAYREVPRPPVQHPMNVEADPKAARADQQTPGVPLHHH